MSVSVLANSLEISSIQRLCDRDVDQKEKKNFLWREATIVEGMEEKQNIYIFRITLQQAFSKDGRRGEDRNLQSLRVAGGGGEE